MIRVNGEERAVAASDVAALLRELGIEPRGVAVARNGDVVPRSRWADTVLEPGDIIEIVTAAAGG